MTPPQDPTHGRGAADERVRLVAIRDTPLDADEVLKIVADPAAGGVNLFTGVVRDHDHGEAVQRLEYVAHPGAAALLAEVAAEVAAEFEVIAVAAVHRTGVLEIGDTAVVVAASAAHRDAAYLASRELIDRLKARVPIWKKQQLTDGEQEWVDPTC